MLRTLMPRKGLSYPVDDAWRARVEKRLAELGMTRAKLARAAGCQRSLITELLNTASGEGQRNQTTYLPEIHAALRWPEPQPVLGPSEVPELAYLFERLDEAGRAHVVAAARREMDRLLRKEQMPSAKHRPGIKKS